jgi:hypothetical protein
LRRASSSRANRTGASGRAASCRIGCASNSGSLPGTFPPRPPAIDRCCA